MTVLNLTTFKLVGKVALATDMDPNGSFYSFSQELEASEQMALLDEQLMASAGQSNRLGLAIFGPEASQYWYGVQVPTNIVTPTGWTSYQVPAGPAFVLTQAQPQYLAQVGVNYKMDQVYDAAAKAKVALPDSLGHAQLPFFVEKMTFKTNLDELTSQSYAIYQSPEMAALED
ncbi:hypothetical protein [Lapidilactobacillus gannanensis]|uniref:Uncharacterized protein n=1 Tax=Lapidilactobacillus gannanensis TaxID=2486002 RepID=A0ABW4BNU4_9LACO|nr:hypothetical protein [Lapidilactobacillus gannanensis]